MKAEAAANLIFPLLLTKASQKAEESEISVVARDEEKLPSNEREVSPKNAGGWFQFGGKAIA